MISVSFRFILHIFELFLEIIDEQQKNAHAILESEVEKKPWQQKILQLNFNRHANCRRKCFERKKTILNFGFCIFLLRKKERYGHTNMQYAYPFADILISI